MTALLSKGFPDILGTAADTVFGTAMINRRTARAGRRAKGHLAPQLAPLFVLLLSAPRAQTWTLDAYLRSGSGNNRALAQFDSGQIAAAVGSGTTADLAPPGAEQEHEDQSRLLFFDAKREVGSYDVALPLPH